MTLPSRSVSSRLPTPATCEPDPRPCGSTPPDGGVARAAGLAGGLRRHGYDLVTPADFELPSYRDLVVT